MAENEPGSVFAALAETLLGSAITLTAQDVAKRTRVPAEVNAARWRTFGHPDVGEEQVAFTESDVEALMAIDKLMSDHPVDKSAEDSILRTIGRTFSRLAEWEVRTILQSIIEPETEQVSAQHLQQLAETLNLGAKVHENVWRRHLAAAATRLALQHAAAEDTEVGCAGFVDIVGFTSRSRSMTVPDLAALVERFESVVSDLVFEHHGRVVKTIGDEVLFVVDDPVDAAWLGAELINQHVHDAAFPQVRVGMAYGDIFNRLGDVLGPVVNLASRLTSAATRGRAIIDPNMAEYVVGTSGLRLRRMRRIYVRGFELVEPWSLRLEREGRRGGFRGALDDMVEDATDELTRRLPLISS